MEKKGYCIYIYVYGYIAAKCIYISIYPYIYTHRKRIDTYIDKNL